MYVCMSTIKEKKKMKLKGTRGTWEGLEGEKTRGNDVIILWSKIFLKNYLQNRMKRLNKGKR